MFFNKNMSPDKQGKLAIFYTLVKAKKTMFLIGMEALFHIALFFIIMTLINLIFPNLYLPNEEFWHYLEDYYRQLTSIEKEIKTGIGYVIEQTGRYSIIENGEKVIHTYKAGTVIDTMILKDYLVFKAPDIRFYLLQIFSLTALITLPLSIKTHKKIHEYLLEHAKQYETKIIEGTVILDDHEFIDKYNKLGKNQRNAGIYLSSVYKLKEVTLED